MRFGRGGGALQVHTGLQMGLVLTAAGFGFRHGIDWDHIAALTDITGSQRSRRRAMAFASLYALGHALVVLLLGFAAIVFASRLPNSLDAIMERFVGVTLVALGLFVVVSLIRDGRDFRMRSRWMLLIGWTRMAVSKVHQNPRRQTVVVEHDHEHDHDTRGRHVHGHPLAAVAPSAASGSVATTVRHRHIHRHVGSMPSDPFADYAAGTAFGIGMLHGVGAETPTQVLIFVTAAGATGKLAGLLVLVSFLAGLLISNSVVAIAATLGFIGAKGNFAIFATITSITALFSLAIGTLFVLGQGALLPTIFSG